MHNLCRIIQKSIKYLAKLLLAVSKRLESSGYLNLAGDRDIEWSWVISEIPDGPKNLLDFGPGPFELLPLVAVRKGLAVTCFDIRQHKSLIETESLKYINGDISDYNFDGQSFDIIITASTIEHVGLGRYGDSKVEDGDIKAMTLLKSLLTSKGRMLLTIPIGRDAIHGNSHRVYGQEKLPKLLEGFTVVKSEFWSKPDKAIWKKISKEQALTTETTPYYYALGLFVLEKTL